MLIPLVIRLFRHCTAAVKSVADGRHTRGAAIAVSTADGRHTRGAAIAVSTADGRQTMNGTP